ncbi:MAG: relaxase/mobilization nuclease domain-containing protein [Bradyrhizobium sp.]|uniref:relaxase/mobilization nuclease domain-containing protein n=1 Tax=Bradyrhizobium sp. TaxID=376 RepID=UPI003D10B598
MAIIINGKSGCAGGWWADHLRNEEKNDRVAILEYSGLASDNLPDAFREMKGLAADTKADNFFYQANINPQPGETLTPAQWREAVDTLEKNLGLTGQPRVVVEHEKEGRVHRHVVWSRIDQDRGVAISDSLTAPIHERTSRELEIKFDLQRGKSVLIPDREDERPERRPKKYETFRAAGTGIDPEQVKADLRAAKERSDNGHSFRAALEASGDYVLARGDRRDFVVIDRAGDEHSPARRLGMKAAEVRKFMADLDRDDLPSVQEAKVYQLGRQQEREAERKAEAEKQPEPEGRYDALHTTERQVEREQSRGKYDALREAEPPSEIEQAFAAEAGRTTEPNPYPDRDKAEAEWQERVADAAIAQEAAQSGEEKRNRRGEGEAQPDAPGASDGADGASENAIEAEDIRPLGKTTQDIRAAWALSHSVDELEETLAMRGITLAVVSDEEARQSYRRAAFAKEIGNFIPELGKGEIVAVNLHGHAYRLNQWTTGDTREEIDERLSSINRATLPTITDAKEAMREASLAAWVDQKRAEEEKARPASKIETLVANSLNLTMTGHDFADALDIAGLTIARVTGADVIALDALRQGAALSAEVARAEGVTNTDKDARYFGAVAEGELAAVTRQGDVFQLSPHKVDYAEIEQRLGDTEPRLPSVVEARALNEETREKQAEQRRQESDFFRDTRNARSETRDAMRDRRETERSVKNDMHDIRDAGAEAAGKAANAIGRGLLSGLGKFLAGLEGFLFTPARQSPEQQKLDAEAAKEQEAAATLRHEAAKDDEARHAQQRYDEQQRANDLYARFGSLTRNPEETQREQERGRERERD